VRKDPIQAFLVVVMVNTEINRPAAGVCTLPIQRLKSGVLWVCSSPVRFLAADEGAAIGLACRTSLFNVERGLVGEGDYNLRRSKQMEG
jgi:hypothetical protein